MLVPSEFSDDNLQRLVGLQWVDFVEFLAVHDRRESSYSAIAGNPYNEDEEEEEERDRFAAEAAPAAAAAAVKRSSRMHRTQSEAADGGGAAHLKGVLLVAPILGMNRWSWSFCRFYVDCKPPLNTPRQMIMTTGPFQKFMWYSGGLSHLARGH